MLPTLLRQAFEVQRSAQYLISGILYRNKAEEYNSKIHNADIKDESELTESPSFNNHFFYNQILYTGIRFTLSYIFNIKI